MIIMRVVLAIVKCLFATEIMYTLEIHSKLINLKVVNENESCSCLIVVRIIVKFYNVLGVINMF